MSGGYFGYRDFCMENISEDLDKCIKENKEGLKPETLAILGELRDRLKETYQAINQVDYLLSFDIGEETFIKRYNEIMNK